MAWLILFLNPSIIIKHLCMFCLKGTLDQKGYSELVSERRATTYRVS